MKEAAVKPQGYWRIPELVPDLDPMVLPKLETFYFEILRYNQRLDLIPKKSELEGDITQMMDAILGSRVVLNATKASVIYDIGSGNGLPGIVMALLDPARKFILMDADNRKVEFLKLIGEQLGLKNVAVAHRKLEDLEPNSVSCAVSRGFASLSKALLLSRKAFRLDGEYFHFKGSSWVREVGQIPSQLCTYWQPKVVQEYELPVVVTKMAVVSTKKIAE